MNHVDDDEPQIGLVINDYHLHKQYGLFVCQIGIANNKNNKKKTTAALAV